MSMLHQYINKNGFTVGKLKIERFWLRKKRYYRRVMEVFEDVEFFLKKTKLFHRRMSHLFGFRRRQPGAIIILRFEVFGFNIKLTLYDKHTGTTIYNSTGGVAAHKVITERHVQKRDKKGDGVLDKLGFELRSRFGWLCRRFYVSRLRLHLCSYYYPYFFRRVLLSNVFFKSRAHLYFRMLRGHNSQDSNKRWLRHRRM